MPTAQNFEAFFVKRGFQVGAVIPSGNGFIVVCDRPEHARNIYQATPESKRTPVEFHAFVIKKRGILQSLLTTLRIKKS